MCKIFVIIIFIFLTISCSNKTIYSGKILNQENLDNINFKNKENLIQTLGQPSYIDPLENKFFYFSEKKSTRSIFKDEKEYSFVFVFKFDKNDKILNSRVYNINNVKELKLVEQKTENNLINRGLLERIFGGVGTQQELPTSP